VHSVAWAATEQGVELVLPVVGGAHLAALQPTIEGPMPEIPATRALQQIAAEGGHIP